MGVINFARFLKNTRTNSWTYGRTDIRADVQSDVHVSEIKKKNMRKTHRWWRTIFQPRRKVSVTRPRISWPAPRHSGLLPPIGFRRRFARCWRCTVCCIRTLRQLVRPGKRSSPTDVCGRSGCLDRPTVGRVWSRPVKSERCSVWSCGTLCSSDCRTRPANRKLARTLQSRRTCRTPLTSWRTLDVCCTPSTCRISNRHLGLRFAPAGVVRNLRYRSDRRNCRRSTIQTGGRYAFMDVDDHWWKIGEGKRRTRRRHK